nr:hypothetical protein [Dehalococcoidia bacterium]
AAGGSNEAVRVAKGLAEQVVTRAETVYPIPDGLDSGAALHLGISYGTAYGALHWRARLQPGETLLVLAAAGAVGLASVYDRVPKLEPWRYSVPLSVALILLSAGALLYGPAATVARSREGQHRGLDGLAYLSSDPGLVAAINWAQANLDHHDVLLEAVGADYQGGNIVSAATGIPTLIGWPGHQIQWRGKIPAIAERENVVARVYQEGATEDVRALARRYGVTHVYIGSEERTQFGANVAARFDAWPAVFDAPGVRIVAVPEAGANP